MKVMTGIRAGQGAAWQREYLDCLQKKADLTAQINSLQSGTTGGSSTTTTTPTTNTSTVYYPSSTGTTAGNCCGGIVGNVYYPDQSGLCA
jgi:hypothetical protein